MFAAKRLPRTEHATLADALQLLDSSFVQDEFRAFRGSGLIHGGIDWLNDQLWHCNRRLFLLNQRLRRRVVHSFQMKSQVHALSIRLAARCAHVRTFARVRLLVRLEVTELRVGIVADRTHVRLFSRVSSHVNRQRVLVDKSLQCTYYTHAHTHTHAVLVAGANLIIKSSY